MLKALLKKHDSIDLKDRFKIFALLADMTKLFDKKFFFLSVVSGVSFTAIMLLFTHTITKVDEQGAKTKFLILYVLANIIYYFSTKGLLYKTSDAIVDAVQTKRKALVDKISKCNLEFVEKMEEGSVYNQIIISLSTIANMSINIVGAIPSLIVLFLSMVYLLYLSKSIFFIAIVMIALGLWLSNHQLTAMERQIGETSREESKMNKLIYGLLKGFKEIKFNRLKGFDLKNDFVNVSDDSGEMMRKTQYRMSDMIYIGDLYSKSMIALFIIFLPTMVDSFKFDDDSNTKIITAGFFMLGPIITLLWMANYNSQVNQSIAGINHLEKTFDDHIANNPEGENDDFSEFKELEVENLSYEYKDKSNEHLFTCGPVNFKINRGEIIYIVGGNGSGKSTFLKIFTGLYNSLGNIKIDGIVIDEDNIQSYRELYSSVFTDFHIFEKLYGAKSIKARRINELLKEFEIDHKTEFKNGKFTNIDLSTGQRKRLALIAALLEEKPIIVLDEWAADQDPEFRKIFYRRIIPELKSMNKTVFAVSHDETYFDTCDRLVKMHNGKLKELDKNIFQDKNYV